MWKVQIKGGRCSSQWEISVVREDNVHGQKSWGWFQRDKKILISHNGGPCHWPIPGYVFDENVKIAEEVARRLNAGEEIWEGGPKRITTISIGGKTFDVKPDDFVDRGGED